MNFLLKAIKNYMHWLHQHTDLKKTGKKSLQYSFFTVQNQQARYRLISSTKQTSQKTVGSTNLIFKIVTLFIQVKSGGPSKLDFPNIQDAD